jgi:hypothetical protein
VVRLRDDRRRRLRDGRRDLVRNAGLVAIVSSGVGIDFAHALDVAMETLAELPAPSSGPAYVVDPTQFDRHVGSYNDPWSIGDMTITRDGDNLQIEMAMLEGLGYVVEPTLIPVSSDIFVASIAGSYFELTFIPATAGSDSQYVRNQSFVEVRVPSGPPKAALRTPRREDVARWLAETRRGPAPERFFLPPRPPMTPR